MSDREEKMDDTDGGLCEEIVRLSPDPIVVIQEHMHVFVNPAFTKLFGYTERDIRRGLSFFELVDNSDIEVCRTRYKERLVGQPLSRTFLINLVAKDGVRIYCETSTETIQYRGQPAALVIVRDIGERKSEEEDLADKRTLLELIAKFEQRTQNQDVEVAFIESLDLMQVTIPYSLFSIALHHEDQNGFAIVHHHEDLNWFEGDPFIKDGASALSHVWSSRQSLHRPDLVADESDYNFDQKLLSEGIRSDYVVPLIADDLCLGTLNCGSYSVDGINPLHRQLLELLAPRLASTIRKGQLFDKVKEQEARLNALLENSEEVFLITDRNGIVTWASPSVERIRGINPSVYLGTHALEHLQADHLDSARTLLVRILGNPGVPHKLDYKVRHADDNWYTYEGTATNLLDDSRVNGILLNVRNVTEQRIVEEELQRDERLESLGLLAGGLAHDFNNLLTAILGNIDLTLKRLDPNAQTNARLKRAKRAVVQAGKLTEQLLEFARGGEPAKAMSSIEEIVEEAADFCLHGSNVRYELEKRAPIWPALVDAGQISQVLHNLIINADQAMPDGGVVRIILDNLDGGAEIEPSDPTVSIRIKDEGVGIHDADRGRVFDPYYTTKSGGSGLGLSTAYTIVQRHGGSLKVTSTIGQGATFDIRLPATPEGIIEKRELVEEVNRYRAKVLVMDDEVLVREVIGAMLTELGHMAVLVDSGETAISAYLSALDQKSPFDLVILDLTVPGAMGGKTAARRLLEIDPDCVAIVSSGYSRDFVMSRYKDYGFKGLVRKPYNLAELASALHQVLDR